MFGVVLHLEVFIAVFYFKDFDLSTVVHPFLEVRETENWKAVLLLLLVPVGLSGSNSLQKLASGN